MKKGFCGIEDIISMEQKLLFSFSKRISIIQKPYLYSKWFVFAISIYEKEKDPIEENEGKKRKIRTSKDVGEDVI